MPRLPPVTNTRLLLNWNGIVVVRFREQPRMMQQFG
jgi:hypothetical protein